MELIEQFKLSNEMAFELLVPPLEEKDNYFYEPTEVLHKFDVGTVILNVHEVKTIVMVECMQDIVCQLNDYLKKHYKMNVLASRDTSWLINDFF